MTTYSLRYKNKTVVEVGPKLVLTSRNESCMALKRNSISCKF